MERAARIFLVRFPRSVRRLSATASLGFADGSYLGAFPHVAGLATPLALVAGLLAGSGLLGASWLLPFVVVVAVMAGQLGLAVVVGAGVSRLLIGGDAAPEWGLLAFLFVSCLALPLLPKVALAKMARRLGRPEPGAFAAAAAVHLAATLMVAWAVVSMSGRLGVVEGPIGWGLIVGAGAAAAARMAVQGWTAVSPVLARRVDAIAAGLAEEPGPTSLAERLPPGGRTLLRAGWFLAVLLPVMGTLVNGLFWAVILVAIEAFRGGLPPFRLRRLRTEILQIPAFLRGVLALGAVVGVAVLNRAAEQADLRALPHPAIAMAVATLLALALLFPRAAPEGSGGAEEAS